VECHGNGIVNGEDVITINIPAGVAEGMQLSVSGKGNAGARSGVNGDLIILIEEIEHEHLKRDGQNLLYDHYISFPEVALGTSIDIPTLMVRRELKLSRVLKQGKFSD